MNRILLWGLLLLGGPLVSWGQTGHLTGLVVDAGQGQPLGYTAVALFHEADSSQAGGQLADSLGRFRFRDLAPGRYYLSLHFLGYETAIRGDLSLAPGDSLDLGQVPLQAGSRLLAAVEISGEQRQAYQAIDRQVYVADQFRQALGGSATDVLRNLPGVSVDAEGNISVRGTTGFMVMLDGRQVQTDAATILNQLPANAIADIEVITTPSARYDPDGKAGIIHIKTRRGATDGRYLLVNVLLGLPSLEPYDNAAPARRYGADLTFTYRRGRWDLSAGLDYRRNDQTGRRVGYVNTYLGEVLTEFPSYGERSFDRYAYSARLAAGYSPAAGHRLNGSVYAGRRTQYRTADILYDYQQRRRIAAADFLGPAAYWDLYQETGQVFTGGERLDSLTYYNENLRVRRGDFLIGGLDYAWTLGEAAELTVSALYEHTFLGGPTYNRNLAWPNLLDTLQYQFNTNDNPLDGWRFQVGYRQPWRGARWEAGYQYRFLSHPGDFLYQDRDLENDRWVENPLFTNRIGLQRQIHALYGELSGTYQRLTYAVGLRLEYMDRRVTLAAPDTTYQLRLFNPFPSLNLNYDLGQGWRTRLGYSRRIDRTSTFMMTPFPEQEHSETLEQGDAELLPELVDQGEWGLIKAWADNSLFATAYYRRVNNLINRVNTVYNDSVLNRIYTNVGTGQAWGVEAGATLQPWPWWKIYAGGNVYAYRIRGDLFGDAIDTGNLIYSLNGSMSFTLPRQWGVQLAVNYLSRRVTAQGEDGAFYNPSLTVRKTWDRLTFTAQWLHSDLGLLASNEQRISTVRDDFFTTTNYIYEVDVLMLGLTFRLNQPLAQTNFIKSEFGDQEF